MDNINANVQLAKADLRKEVKIQSLALEGKIKDFQDVQSHQFISSKGHFENLYRANSDSKRSIKVLGEKLKDAVASYQTRFNEWEKFTEVVEDKNKKRSEYVQSKLTVMEDRLHQIRTRIENQDVLFFETKQEFIKEIDELRKDQQNYFKITESTQKAARDQELKSSSLVNQKLDRMEQESEKFTMEVAQTFARGVPRSAFNSKAGN